MTDDRFIDRRVSEFLPLLSPSLGVLAQPPEGDPEYGLDRHIEFPDRGLAVMINASDVCCCVQFFGAGKDPSYCEYVGALPGGVRFTNSRGVARTIMGPLVRGSDGGLAVYGSSTSPGTCSRTTG